jgi:hypothetical protein
MQDVQNALSEGIQGEANNVVSQLNHVVSIKLCLSISEQ